jgi:nucleoside permease NupC
MGFTSLALIYGFFSVTCTFAIPINQRFGYKKTMIMASLSYVTYIFSFLLPVKKSEALAAGQEVDKWYFNDAFVKFVYLGASCLIGIGAGPLWVSNA